MSPAMRTNFGQIIEYIPDRLYLASYTSPPDETTSFPYPTENHRRSPSKRSARIIDGPSPVKSARTTPCYFSVDDTLLYNAFHHDFGPLHIGHLYRFAVQFHDILGAPENKGRPVVFWSKADARSRANAACILACYMVLIQSWAPHVALAPIAQADPPMMPFRDAGYSQADYEITIQDVVYGVWRAKEEGFCALPSFDLEEYERFERVDQGDFNWLTPHFLAFASPQHSPVEPIATTSPLYDALPKNLSEVEDHPTLPRPFKNVLTHFYERDIGLVVRLNSELYCPSFFTALGIEHLDMIFEDGTCPPLSTVRKFITIAHEMITVKKKGIAVHCKAGLGRTGCLIGAYLIYRYGFTANETIAFMRFMRPGMVVGPQQHWLHLNQGTFRKWWELEQFEKEMRAKIEQEIRAKLQSTAPSTPSRSIRKSHLSNGVATPPNGYTAHRSPLGEVDNERNSIGVPEDCLPAPTPGQPRKTSRAVDRHHPYTRTPGVRGGSMSSDEEITIQREAEIVSIHRHSRGGALESDSTGEESTSEWQLRVRQSRKSSRTPRATRSISTTATIYTAIDDEPSNDIENLTSPSRTKSKSGSGVLTATKVRGNASPRRADGVRKTSGRVGSVGVLSGTGSAAMARERERKASVF